MNTERGLELNSYSIDTDNVNSFNDIDMSMLLVEMIKRGTLFRDFIEIFILLARKYEKEKGVKPKIDLIFHSDDLGDDSDTKVSSLQFLKALKEDLLSGQYIGSIIIKSPNENFASVEPNVFSSGIIFKRL